MWEPQTPGTLLACNTYLQGLLKKTAINGRFSVWKLLHVTLLAVDVASRILESFYTIYLVYGRYGIPPQQHVTTDSFYIRPRFYNLNAKDA